VQFSATFLSVIVYGSVVLAALGGLMLLALLARDLIRKDTW
jgi:hypothetical protein